MSVIEGGDAPAAGGRLLPEPAELTQVAEKDDGGAPKPNADLASKMYRWMRMRNIADEMDEIELNRIGMDVVREYELDKSSRSEWETKTKDAMKLATQVSEKKQYPWPGSANVIFPLITSATTQFAARAYPAIISDKNVVKGVVIGQDQGTPEMGPLGPKVDPQTNQPKWLTAPGEKTRRAKEIGDHMSWQLLEEMTEWEPQTDQLLHILPIVGCIFRKTFFDPGRGRNCSHLVTAMDLVINYWAKDLDSAPRVTECLRLYPNEVDERERTGLFIPITYTTENPTDSNRPGSQNPLDNDAPREYLEQHRLLDLDDDGFREPYIVTVHKTTSKVVRIVARYDADGVLFNDKGEVAKINPIQYYTQYNFMPSLDGGVYGIGFGQLLKPLNEAVNTTLNMLIDSGHLSVTGGGFVGRQLSMSTGTMRFSPGEFKSVNATGQTVRDSVFQLQFPQPSNVLFQLLTLLIDAGKEIASVKDILMGDQQNSNVPATTTLALIEQGLKVFTGIYKRIYRSLKSELDKLYRLNRIYLDVEAQYQIGDTWRTITQEDYEKGSGVKPICDPTMVSDMQRCARAQFLLSVKDDPALNKQEIYTRVFDAIHEEMPEKLFAPGQQNPSPEIALAALELEVRGKRYAAQEVYDIARAVQAMAQAITAVGPQQAGALAKEGDAAKQQYEGNSQNQQQPQQQQQPPVNGARQAPDGHWYVPDPDRAGKYLRVRA